ncbi:MAG: M16 family metallopeptidase [bacterium]
MNKEESPPEPPQNQFKYAFFKGDIQQSHLRIGFHTPEILHPDTYALEILAFILGAGRSSRLFKKIREQERLVQSVSAYNYSLENVGIFVLSATIARPDNLRAAAFSIFAELAKLQDRPIPAEELSKAKTILESIYVYNLETTSGQADSLASYEALGDYHMAERYIQALYDVSTEDIRRVAQKYLTLNNCSLLEYVPEQSNLEPCDADDYEKWIKGKCSIGNIHSHSQSEMKPAKLEFPTHVATGCAEKDTFRTIIPSGLTLLVKESHQIPLVSIGVFAKGGRGCETSRISGLTGLTARTLLKGTRNRRASQIDLEIESLGSTISFSNDPDYLRFTMKILSKNLKPGWDILADVLINPIFPKRELEKEKENTIAQIRQLRDDMFGYPLQLFFSTLFKDHAYGLPANGDVSTVESLTREHLHEWHARHFLPANLVVSVVGDVDVNLVQDLVEEKFGHGESGGARAAENSSPSPDHGSRIENRAKNQTALVMGFSGPDYGSEDYYPLLLLQNAISGLGGRFFEELRGRQGLAYSISTHLVSRLTGGAFLAYIATSPENEELALNGLRREFEKVTEKALSDEELRQSAQYTIGTHQIGLETYGSQMVQYAHNELLGRGFEEVATFPERIQNVTPEDILNAARRYIDLDHFALGMVRGKSS